MPARLIQDQHRVRARRDDAADLFKVGLHGLGVAEGHDQTGGLAAGRADRPENVGPFGALIVRRGRAGSSWQQTILIDVPALRKDHRQPVADDR
jgi:hypothetical protein